MNQASIIIRKAEREDAGVITAFNRAMALETENKELDKTTATSGILNLLERKEYGFYLIALKNGQHAGQLMITYEWSDWRDGLFWWIQSVYVKPGYRGEGVYKALYDYILRESRKDKIVKGIRLYVDQSNASAKAVYEKLGMKKAHYDMYEVDFVFEE